MNILSILAGKEDAFVTSAFERFIGIVNIVLPVLMSVLLGMFYGITLGVKYAKAEEEDDKKKAKGALINVIVGVLIAIIFVAVIQIILNGKFVQELFAKTEANSGYRPS